MHGDKPLAGAACGPSPLLTTSDIAFVSFQSEATRGRSETPPSTMPQPELPLTTPGSILGEPGGCTPQDAVLQPSPAQPSRRTKGHREHTGKAQPCVRAGLRSRACSRAPQRACQHKPSPTASPFCQEQRGTRLKLCASPRPGWDLRDSPKNPKKTPKLRQPRPRGR